MKLVATKRLRYGRKDYAPGDTFETETEKHATALTLIGKAKVAPAEERPALASAPVAPVQTAAVKAEDTEDRPRRRYMRRDVRPEE